MIRSANRNATTPPKPMPPFHNTAASGTLPTEQTNEITATTGPIRGPTTFDYTGSCDRKTIVQKLCGTQAASAPANRSPPTMSSHTLAQSIT